MTRCDTCGEWLPHYCAPIITITRLKYGYRTINIQDRGNDGIKGEAFGETRSLQRIYEGSRT